MLSAAGVDLKKLGKAAPCLVADFDGDGVADVLAPFAAGSVLFRGLTPGKFASGVACAVKLGTGQSGACVGDFDGDGRFDVLLRQHRRRPTMAERRRRQVHRRPEPLGRNRLYQQARRNRLHGRRHQQRRPSGCL